MGILISIGFIIFEAVDKHTSELHACKGLQNSSEMCAGMPTASQVRPIYSEHLDHRALQVVSLLAFGERTHVDLTANAIVQPGSSDGPGLRIPGRCCKAGFAGHKEGALRPRIYGSSHSVFNSPQCLCGELRARFF